MDTKIEDVINNTIFQGGFVLRGYEPVSFIGSQYHLANAEYRFPIATVDSGVSTLPFFLQRVSGNLFVDYGGAFNKLDIENYRDQFHTGVGGELFLDLQLGYYTLLNIRLGYAKGFGEFAVPGGQKYMAVAAPF
jgi:outer membrane protein assembly factor BamA